MSIAIASLIYGIVVAVSAWLIMTIAYAPRNCRGIHHRFEIDRREKLRKASPAFRYFEPVVDELSLYLEQNNSAAVATFGDNLGGSGNSLPWRPAEFLAAKSVESLFYGLITFGFLTLLGFGGATSVVLAAIIGAGLYWMSMTSIKGKAQKRRKKIKRTFAAAIDLLALMMEVGGSFLDSLKVVAKENQGKDLGDELYQIVNDVELGKPRKQALENFAARMNDEDISEVVFACNESEELGVPLSDTLKVQADRIRQKRSSWAESAAQQAEVSLVFPAMIIMLASLLTVAAPFVLQGLNVYAGNY